MLNFLEWPTLQERRHVNRLSQFHKIDHQLTPSIQLPSYFLPTQYPTIDSFINIDLSSVSSTVSYQKSFFPNTLREWNTLPNNFIEEQSTEILVYQPPCHHTINNFMYAQTCQLSRIRRESHSLASNLTLSRLTLCFSLFQLRISHA